MRVDLHHGSGKDGPAWAADSPAGLLLLGQLMSKRLFPALLVLALAACSLPRSAAMQSEILAGTQDEATRTIQVMPVTRETLPQLAAWPAPPQAIGGYGAWPTGGLRTPDSMTIAPGDQLQITVWDNEENSLLTSPAAKSVGLTEMTVGNDGTIFMPYVGRVKVGGLGPEHAREQLQTSLAAALPSAQLQVAIKPGRRNTVDLIGGVARPGSYPLPDRNYSVLALLSEGGGIAANIESPVIKLVRGGKTHGIPAPALFAQPGRDVSLRGGDKVVVEKDARYFIALGATGRQSTVHFPQEQVSALDAVSLVGGVNPGRANLQGVLILREYAARQVRNDGRGPDRDRVVFTVDLTSADGLFSARNFPIRHGDLVLATESPVTNTRTIFGLIGQLFGLANQIGE